MYHRYRPYYPTTIDNLHNELSLLQRWLSRWSYAPEEWGPRLWFYLHTSSIFAEELSPLSTQQWEALHMWFRSINRLIPCKKCSSTKLPKTNVTCPRDITKALIGYHNKINRRFGKPMLTEEEARSLYTSFVRRRGNR